MNRDIGSPPARYRDEASQPIWRIGFLAVLLAAAAILGGCGTDQTGLGVNLIPEEQVEAMSQQSWQKLRNDVPASTSRGYQQRLDQVAGRVLKAAGQNPAAWETVVFQGDQVNAFALPGGKIGVYEGMMKTVQNDDQLAAVIGHEIAHNRKDHAAQRLNSQAVTQLGINLAATALGGEQADAVAGLLNAGAQYGVLLPYSRNQELEADRLGLRYMASAGYDPHDAVAFWERMSRQNDGGRPPTFASTHPSPEQRIAQIKQQIAEL